MDTSTDQQIKLRPVLVTGASGFVGSHVVREMLDHGYTVRVMVRTEGQALAFRSLGVETVTGDLQKPESLAGVVRGVGSILHIASIFRQAGLPDEVYRDVNATGTQRLIDAATAAGVARFIHCSTNGVHGGIKNPPGNEDSPVKPGDIYQESKWEGEQIAMRAFESGRIRGAVLRPAMIYGPGDTRLLKIFRMIARRRFFYIGRGDAFVHYIDVRDLARAFRLALEHTGVNARAYIIAGREMVTLRDSVERIAKIIGVPPPWLRLPVKPMQWAGSVCEALCRPFNIEPPIFRRRVDFYTKHRGFDVSRAAREIGFKAAQGLDSELREISDWYWAHGYYPQCPPVAPPPSPAELDALSAGATFVRTAGGRILRWSAEAETLYGFSRAEAEGSFAHILLRTAFPVTLDVLDEHAARTGAWSGRLRQKRRDGGTVEVGAEWRTGAAGGVVERHSSAE